MTFRDIIKHTHTHYDKHTGYTIHRLVMYDSCKAIKIPHQHHETHILTHADIMKTCTP